MPVTITDLAQLQRVNLHLGLFLFRFYILGSGIAHIESSCANKHQLLLLQHYRLARYCNTRALGITMLPCPAVPLFASLYNWMATVQLNLDLPMGLGLVTKSSRNAAFHSSDQDEIVCIQQMRV